MTDYSNQANRGNEPSTDHPKQANRGNEPSGYKPPSSLALHLHICYSVVATAELANISGIPYAELSEVLYRQAARLMTKIWNQTHGDDKTNI